MKINQKLSAENFALPSFASLQALPSNASSIKAKDGFEILQWKPSPTFITSAKTNSSLTRISNLFNLAIINHKPLGGGENFVYLINDQFIFRFPKTDLALSANRREQIVLKALQAYVKSTKIPVYNFWNYEHGIGGYEEIKGIALSYKFYNGLNTEQKSLLARDLALAISEIHSLPQEKTPLSNCLPEIRDYMNVVSSHLKKPSIFAQAEVTTIQNALSIVENNFSSGDFTPVVIHSDLHCDNIIVDPSNKVLSGLIDFSDARIGPAVVDFSNLYRVNPLLAENSALIYAQMNKLDEKKFLQECRAWSIVWLAACIAHNYNGHSLREQKRVMRAGRAFSYLLALKKL